MTETFSIAPQLIANALMAGSIYALAASGLAITYGVSRVLNFAHGQLMMIGAYLFLASREGLISALGESGLNASAGSLLWEFALPGAAALIGTGGVAVLAYRAGVAPFRGRSLLLPFVATVAIGKILENTVAIVFGVNVRSLSGSVDSFNLFGAYVTVAQCVTVATALCTLLAVAAIMGHTRFGRQLRALRAHPSAASALGVGVDATLARAFLFSGALAALAGIFIAFDTSLQPTMGGSYTIKALTVMVLGGLGNTWGTVVASFILAGIETVIVGVDFGSWSIPVGYRDAVAFVVLLAILLVRPSGLFSSGESRERKV